MVQSVMHDEAVSTVETIGYLDKLKVIAEVLLPTMAKGVVLRRPTMMALAERFDIDKRAVRRLKSLREKYGSGPLMLSVLGRKHALILAKGDLIRVLADAPASFSPASDQKRAMLGHFEPHVSLTSRGVDRVERRRLNDEALESGCPNHSFAARFAKVASEEARALLAYAGPTLTWDEFSPVWDRIVRRVVLGDAARDDTHLSYLLKTLRGDGNWASLRSRNTRVFDAYMRRLNQHLARAEPGSLAAALAKAPKTANSEPGSQATHWIFAFDAGAIAAFSALALLATHPDQRLRAVREAEDVAAGDGSSPSLPFLRSCVLEALRLWPTTMIVHRKSTEETSWDSGVLPAGISVLLFAPYFHREDGAVANANTFAPDIWMDDPGRTKLPLIPFSAGPGLCPGRHIVLLTAAALLGEMVKTREIGLAGGHRLEPGSDLPGTLNHFALEIDIATERAASRASASYPALSPAERVQGCPAAAS